MSILGLESLPKPRMKAPLDHLGAADRPDRAFAEIRFSARVASPSLPLRRQLAVAAPGRLVAAPGAAFGSTTRRHDVFGSLETALCADGAPVSATVRPIPAPALIACCAALMQITAALIRLYFAILQ